MEGLTGVAAGFVALLVFGGAVITSGDGEEITVTSQEQVEESAPVAKKVEGVEVTLKGVNGLSWVAISDSSGATQYSGRIRQAKN